MNAYYYVSCRWYLMNSKELLERKADLTQPFPTPVR